MNHESFYLSALYIKIHNNLFEGHIVEWWLDLKFPNSSETCLFDAASDQRVIHLNLPVLIRRPWQRLQHHPCQFYCVYPHRPDPWTYQLLDNNMQKKKKNRKKGDTRGTSPRPSPKQWRARRPSWTGTKCEQWQWHSTSAQNVNSNHGGHNELQVQASSAFFTIYSIPITSHFPLELSLLFLHAQETKLNHWRAVGFLAQGFASTPEMTKRNLVWVSRKMHMVVDDYPLW